MVVSEPLNSSSVSVLWLCLLFRLLSRSRRGSTLWPHSLIFLYQSVLVCARVMVIFCVRAFVCNCLSVCVCVCSCVNKFKVSFVFYFVYRPVCNLGISVHLAFLCMFCVKYGCTFVGFYWISMCFCVMCVLIWNNVCVLTCLSVCLYLRLLKI